MKPTAKEKKKDKKSKMVEPPKKQKKKKKGFFSNLFGGKEKEEKESTPQQEAPEIIEQQQQELRSSQGSKKTPTIDNVLNNSFEELKKYRQQPWEKLLGGSQAFSRRNSLKGVALIEDNPQVRKAASMINEGDFKRQLPTLLEIIDFYQTSPMQALTLFPDIPEEYKEPFMLLNLIRAQPQLFCKSYIEKFRARFVQVDNEQGEQAFMYVSVDKNKGFQTKEGLYAFEECLYKLKHMKSVPPLQWNNDLHSASKEHVDDIGPLGLYGHSGSLGLSMYDRFRNYSQKEPGMLAENILFGTINPVECIVLMLIDDGDPDIRKMRDNLLDPVHQYIGFSVGKHLVQSGMCVAMMCMEFLEKQQIEEMQRAVKEEDERYEY